MPNQLNMSVVPSSMLHRPLPLVIIAASAGGLGPISEILDHYPSHLEVATVVIQHLSPDYRSELVKLLQSHTEQSVHELCDGTVLQAKNIYVIQPGMQIMLEGNTIKAVTREDSRRPYFTIDVFLESVALRANPVAACVVLLSGTGTDGSAGCRAIHERGGYILVQQLSDAKFDGMPLSLINTGFYDEVLPAALIPERIVTWLENGLQKPPHPGKKRHDDPTGLLYPGADPAMHADSEHIQQVAPYAGIFALIRSSFDLDLDAYKIGTIQRRITQRMRRQGFDTIEQYHNLLLHSGHELRALANDLMVGVTEFFRNPAVFELLQTQTLPDLLQRNQADPLKLWVCACSTGEEAYSLGMLLHKLVLQTAAPREFRIYATDLNAEAIRRAAEGWYEYGALQPLVDRFGLEECVEASEDGAHLRVIAEVRRKIIFSVQNVLKHSPLHALDMISCRNMLIYLRPEAQRKVISNFHFGLKENGILLLGESEGPAGLEPYFSDLDSRAKLYAKRPGIRLNASDRWQLNRTIPSIPAKRADITARGDASPPSIPRGAFEAAFSTVAGNSLIIRVDGEVQYFTGYSGEIFSRAIPGRPSLNLHTHLADAQLQSLLQLGLAEALENPTAIQWDYPYTQKEGQLAFDQLRFTRLPAAFESEPSVLVQMLATEGSPASTPNQPPSLQHAHDVLAVLQSGTGGLGRLARLEQENAQLRQIVTESVQDKETFHEELQSANEELLSSNEELQSTNEELQSVNEELHSVNAELEEKIRLLTEAKNDINNLLISTEVALVFLDENLNIRRYTEAARSYFPLSPHDIGRPLQDLATRLEGLDINDHGKQVLRSSSSQSHEIRLQQQQWAQVQFYPYNDHLGTVRGVVMTIMDISHTRQLLQVERQNRLHRELVQSVMIIGHLEIPDLGSSEVVLDDNLQAFFNLPHGQRLDQHSLLGHVHPDDVELAHTTLTTTPRDSERLTAEFRLRDGHGKYHWMLCNTASNPSSIGNIGLIAMLLDVDRHKRADIHYHEQEISAIHANRIFNIGMLVSGVAHELNNPLSALRLGNEQLQQQATAAQPNCSRLARIASSQTDAVERMDRIISSLLRFSRKDEETAMKMVHIETLVQDTVQLSSAMASDARVEILHDPVPSQYTLLGHPLELAQALLNLVSNAIQHVASMPRPRWVRIQVLAEGDDYLFQVVDSGLSAAIEHPERLFMPFYTTKDVGLGTGLGLPLSQGIAEAHGGHIILDRQARHTTFVMKIPSRPGQAE